MYRFEKEKGAILILTFIVLVTLTVIVLAFASMVSDEIGSTGAGLMNMRAFYIAEAGLAKARWELTAGGETAGFGEEDISFGAGTYTFTTTDNGDNTITIVSEGYIPDDINPVAKRRVIEKDIPITFTNLSLSATASASSVQGPNTADRAIDGDSGTRWKSSVNNGSWLKLDFLSSITFDRITFDGTKIDTYAIMYSGDDIAYQAVTNPVESPAGTVTFDAVLARYLRFDVNGNRPEVIELETFDVAGSEPTLGQGKFVTSW